MNIPKGYFKHNYNLSGRDWVRRISDEDRKALLHCARAKSDYGRKGGIARAKTAKRDENGKFVKG